MQLMHLRTMKAADLCIYVIAVYKLMCTKKKIMKPHMVAVIMYSRDRKKVELYTVYLSQRVKLHLITQVQGQSHWKDLEARLRFQFSI